MYELKETASSMRNNQTKNASKNVKYYSNDDVLLWKATLKAEFTYDGDSATCILSNINFTTYTSLWQCKNSSATKNGPQARGSITAISLTANTNQKEVTKLLIIKCSPSGKTS